MVGSGCTVVFAVLMGVVVAVEGLAGVDADDDGADDAVVPGGVTLVDDGALEVDVDGGVDAEGVVVPPAAGVVEAVLDPAAGGVVTGGVDGVVVGGVVEVVVEPGVVDGVVAGADGVLFSGVVAALPQMSSFDTLSLLPVVDGVADGVDVEGVDVEGVVEAVVAGGGGVVAAGGVVDAVAFAPLLP